MASYRWEQKLKIDADKNQKSSNRAFHGFGQDKFPYGGSVLGSSQFTPLPQLPLKMTLDLKVVKIDSEVIPLFH